VFGGVHNEVAALPYYSALDRMITSEREKAVLVNKL